MSWVLLWTPIDRIISDYLEGIIQLQKDHRLIIDGRIDDISGLRLHPSFLHEVAVRGRRHFGARRSSDNKQRPLFRELQAEVERRLRRWQGQAGNPVEKLNAIAQHRWIWKSFVAKKVFAPNRLSNPLRLKNILFFRPLTQLVLKLPHYAKLHNGWDLCNKQIYISEIKRPEIVTEVRLKGSFSNFWKLYSKAIWRGTGDTEKKQMSKKKNSR